MKKILIVDDIENNRYLLDRLLSGNGYAVEEAKNGAEALACARKASPDLVISDLLMPVMDGFELCRQWKADSGLKNIPFMVHTATYTEPKDEQLVLNLGADKFIIKPQQPESLLGIVRDILRETGAPYEAKKPRDDEMEALREYNEVLFHKLEQKMATLETNYEKLKEYDHLKSNFISIISHELRTPLTIIKGFTSFLMKDAAGVLNDTQKNFVNTIDLNVLRLARIINDMVDISRIESGTFAMEKERRDFTGILNETVDSMDCIANNCGVTVERDIKIKSAPVEADKGRLIQAISNILNNAIRYSRKGGSIKVELDHAGTKNMPEKIRAALLEDHVYYSLRVIDRGPGLEKKYMEKIFERFFQVENADTRSHQGAGLGLSVAKSIVEEHGGLIYAESEGPGKGLTICLLMPE